MLKIFSIPDETIFNSLLAKCNRLTPYWIVNIYGTAVDKVLGGGLRAAIFLLSLP